MIQVYRRDLNEKNKEIRKSGYILGLISNPTSGSNIPIKIPKTPFLRFIESTRNNINVDLVLDGEIKKCIITEVQSQPAFEGYLHINFRCNE